MTERTALLEALLFVAEAPLSLERLCQLMDVPRDEVRETLKTLLDRYQPGRGGVFLAEVAGGYQFRTDPQFAPWLRQLHKERVQRMSAAALETLAIVAYRQPITRAEIEYLRGVDSGAVMKTLLERNLLRILGKKDIPGRPLIYGTSKYFLEFFGLRDLADLPTLKEFAALEPELAEAVPLDPGDLRGEA